MLPLFSPSVHRFIVGVEPGTKLESGPASLHLCNNLLVLTRGVPPVTIGHWKLSALRRYGAVPNGFVFEGGTRCGYCKLLVARLLFMVSFYTAAEQSECKNIFFLPAKKRLLLNEHLPRV